MIEPAYALLRHAMDNDIYLQYMDGLEEYRTCQKNFSTFYEELSVLFGVEAKKQLDILLDEDMLKTVAETVAAFTTGLAFGLQLLRLL